MIRVVVVDDQAVVREGLRAIVQRDGDVEVVAEAADGRAGVEAVRAHRPDVVLMDLRMPRMDGVAATRALVDDARLPDVRVLVLTTFDDEPDVLAAIRAGAAGYVLKDVAPTELRQAIRAVAAGGATLSPSVATTVLGEVAGSPTARIRPELVDGLTEREREVLVEVGRGRTNDEVGRALHISPATARTYVSRLLARLGARDRSALVAIAYEAGLVRPGAGTFEP
ncbi:response regulator [Agrococcus jejuensis]|uniref:DNA-binding response regulator, NarL/FixJ family, contains REC and HTH domains n=1 Tax=Agrococcus jejuensis TaxID=399736 RepID=A0A1G8FV89_9MICO|nr:response regulator transcription factor [Agrococcus jejuensis]SDH86041.1 DNA-binding response regulator, NarL/FixJ family, contains REC and HTH domains [Agrococcus jejuensis]